MPEHPHHHTPTKRKQKGHLGFSLTLLGKQLGGRKTPSPAYQRWMIIYPSVSTMDDNLPQRIKWRRSMIISPSVSRDGSSASPRRINPLGTDSGSGRIKSPSVSTKEDNIPRRINPSAGHLFPQSVPGHPRSLRVWFPQEERRFNLLVMSNHGQTNHSGV